MNRPMTDYRLRMENLAFAGTSGVSENANKSRFLPAFKDLETGRVEMACLASGEPAPCHLICCLPDDWAIAWNDLGEVTALKASVIAGFIRDDQFYTREEAASLA